MVETVEMVEMVAMAKVEKEVKEVKEVKQKERHHDALLTQDDSTLGSILSVWQGSQQSWTPRPSSSPRCVWATCTASAAPITGAGTHTRNGRATSTAHRVSTIQPMAR